MKIKDYLGNLRKLERKDIFMKIYTSILYFIIFLFIILIIIHPTAKVIKSWESTNKIYYNGFSYYLKVVEDEISIGRFPFGVTRQYIIYVGIDPGKPEHGYILDYSFPEMEGLYNISDYLKKCTVIWSQDGVTFEEPEGNKLFIPEKSFVISGRS
jgi:hypothetical protein